MVGDTMTIAGVAYEVLWDGSKTAPSLLSDYSRGSTLAGLAQGPSKMTSRRQYDAERMTAEATWAPARRPA